LKLVQLVREFFRLILKAFVNLEKVYPSLMKQMEIQREKVQAPSFKLKKEKRKSWLGFESATELLEFHSFSGE
jgi:hypothetical protein